MGGVGGRTGSGVSEARGRTKRGGEKELSKRTLTNLYNARPQWLADAHAALDAAVAAAYGWSPDISKEDALGTLLELNRARST